MITFHACIPLGVNPKLNVPEALSYPLSFIDSKRLDMGYCALQKLLLFVPRRVLKIIV
jgi:hypothetical protein